MYLNTESVTQNDFCLCDSEVQFTTHVGMILAPCDRAYPDMIHTQWKDEYQR